MTATGPAEMLVAIALGALTGVPGMAGVWIGWCVADAVPTRALRYVRSGSLFILRPVLLLTR